MERGVVNVLDCGADPDLLGDLHLSERRIRALVAGVEWDWEEIALPKFWDHRLD